MPRVVVSLSFNLADPILAPQPTQHELRSLGRELIDKTLGDLAVDDLDVDTQPTSCARLRKALTFWSSACPTRRR